jgi:hypothetical protein
MARPPAVVLATTSCTKEPAVTALFVVEEFELLTSVVPAGELAASVATAFGVMLFPAASFRVIVPESVPARVFVTCTRQPVMVAAWGN